ncbi:hypothetical protein KH5H1_01500 [Corallococcus caeni]|nr:hypothetical protein KH5H1_01500 [Corallococcus sp. KH5-1]
MDGNDRAFALGAKMPWSLVRFVQGGGASHVNACSRPVVKGLVGITFLEFLRAQLVGEWYPGTGSRKTLWSVALGIGLELGP